METIDKPEKVIDALHEKMLELAEQELGLNPPEWVDDLIDYLFNKNQVIFFIDENMDLDGYVCFWRYGKKRFTWIKKGLRGLHKNPTNMTQGDYVYIPLCVVKQEKAEGFLDRSVHSIKQLIPEVREISYHAPDGRFTRIIMEDEL